MRRPGSLAASSFSDTLLKVEVQRSRRSVIQIQSQSTTRILPGALRSPGRLIKIIQRCIKRVGRIPVDDCRRPARSKGRTTDRFGGRCLAVWSALAAAQCESDRNIASGCHLIENLLVKEKTRISKPAKPILNGDRKTTCRLISCRVHSRDLHNGRADGKLKA